MRPAPRAAHQACRSGTQAAVPRPGAWRAVAQAITFSRYPRGKSLDIVRLAAAGLRPRPAAYPRQRPHRWRPERLRRRQTDQAQRPAVDAAKPTRTCSSRTTRQRQRSRQPRSGRDLAPIGHQFQVSFHSALIARRYALTVIFLVYTRAFAYAVSPRRGGRVAEGGGLLSRQ